VPRPKPRAGSSRFTATAFCLDESQRRDLAHLLGYSSPDTYNAARALREAAKWLGFYKPAVTATASAPRAAIVRGRPTDDVLLHVVNQLRRIFDVFYRGDTKPRPAQDQCRQFALLTSVVETNPDLSRRALDHDAVPAHHRVARHTTRHSRSVGSGASRGQCHGPNEILRHSWSVKRDKAPHAPWTDAVCRHWRSSLTALEPERTKSPSMQPQRAPARGAGCLGPLFLAAIRPSATVGVRP